MNRVYQRLALLSGVKMGSGFDREKFMRLSELAFSLGFRLWGYGNEKKLTLVKRVTYKSKKFNSFKKLEDYLHSLQ